MRILLSMYLWASSVYAKIVTSISFERSLQKLRIKNRPWQSSDFKLTVGQFDGAKNYEYFGGLVKKKKKYTFDWHELPRFIINCRKQR